MQAARSPTKSTYGMCLEGIWAPEVWSALDKGAAIYSSSSWSSLEGCVEGPKHKGLKEIFIEQSQTTKNLCLSNQQLKKDDFLQMQNAMQVLVVF